MDMAYKSEEITTCVALADEAFYNKDFKQAVLILEDIAEKYPDNVQINRKLGSYLVNTETPQNAFFYLNKAITLMPDDAENWKELGNYYNHINAWEKAKDALRKSWGLSGDNEYILYELVKVHYKLSDNDTAIFLVQKLIAMAPDNIDYLWNYAQLLKKNGKTEKALEYYNRLINGDNAKIPTSIIEEWYDLMSLHGRSKEASQWLYMQMNNSKNIEMKWLYSKYLIDEQSYSEALSILEDAHKAEPNNIKYIQNICEVCFYIGDKQKMLYYLNKVLDIDPLQAYALRSLSTIHKYTYGDDAFRRLNYAEIYLPNMSIKYKFNLHYALGKAYDDTGELTTAFEHYKRAGIYHSQGDQSDYRNLSIFTNFITRKITKSTFNKSIIQGCQSNKPIFIIGMPRSGTTLLEQTLSSMQNIYGAGELQTALKALNGIEIEGKKFNMGTIAHFAKLDTPSINDRGEYYVSQTELLAPKGSEYIIDKLPANFMFAGLIHLMLPNASIIHARRHPVETCLSAYRLPFSAGLDWSDDLRTMGRYYRLYTELMAFWKSVLPEGTILDVRYEDIVNDHEKESKRLADYIGIPWDASCLNFHHSKRAVNTASAIQVRQPIYKTSMNRWQKYKPYLKPLLDEIGDLVEEYEAELLKN